MSIGVSLREIWHCLRAWPGASLALAFTVLIDTAFETSLPIAFSWLIDKALVPRDPAAFILPAVLIGAGWLISAGSQVLRDWVHARLTARVSRRLRTDLEDHLHRLDYGSWKREKPADWLALFSRDIAIIEGFMANILPILLFSILYLVLALVAIGSTNLLLGLVVLFGLPLAMIGPRFLGKPSFERGETAARAESEAASALEEQFLALPLIRVYSLEAVLRQGFQERLVRLERLSRSFFLFSNLNRRSPNLSVHVLQIVILLTGAWLVIQGNMELGQLVAANLLFANVLMAVLDFSLVMGPLTQCGIAFSRLNQKAHQPPASAELVSLEPEAGDTGGLALRLRHVHFGWRGQRTIFTDLSFDLPKGQRIAIVGSSGSGKSTLAGLILGLYAPQSGLLWRSPGSCGAVFQDTTIFDDSLRYNILLGSDPGPDEVRLRLAVEQAGLAEWIRSLPGGLDTQAGDRGGFLSGGQKQRLALARALVRRPDLLVLDEVTSALDPLSESLVNASLRQLAGPMTIIHITHRLTGITDYDRILVLDQGLIAEQGRHEELLAIPQGQYALMWQRQSGLVVGADSQARISVAALRTIPLFSASNTVTLVGLSRAFVSETAAKDSVIIRQGTPGSRFFIVARGRVEVTIKGSVVASLADGDFFGEMSLLHASLTSATVTARDETILLALDKESFLKAVARDLSLAQRVEAEAARRQAANTQRTSP